MEITELQVDFNTTSAILDDTEDDLRDMKSDLRDAWTKIEHTKGDLMWEKFFNGLEAEDAKQEVADAKQEAADARQEAADARQEEADARSRRKSSGNIRQKRTIGTRTTPVVAKHRKL
jgi:uncharacterized protein (DUF3084 family)